MLSDGVCVFFFASGRVTWRCGARALWLRRCVFFFFCCFVRYRHNTLHFSVTTDVYSAFCRHRCDVIRCPARQLPCVLFSCRLTSRHRPLNLHIFVSVYIVKGPDGRGVKGKVVTPGYPLVVSTVWAGYCRPSSGECISGSSRAALCV